MNTKTSQIASHYGKKIYKYALYVCDPGRIVDRYFGNPVANVIVVRDSMLRLVYEIGVGRAVPYKRAEKKFGNKYRYAYQRHAESRIGFSETVHRFNQVMQCLTTSLVNSYTQRKVRPFFVKRYGQHREIASGFFFKVSNADSSLKRVCDYLVMDSDIELYEKYNINRLYRVLSTRRGASYTYKKLIRTPKGQLIASMVSNLLHKPYAFYLAYTEATPAGKYLIDVVLKGIKGDRCLEIFESVMQKGARQVSQIKRIKAITNIGKHIYIRDAGSVRARKRTTHSKGCSVYEIYFCRVAKSARDRSLGDHINEQVERDLNGSNSY